MTIQQLSREQMAEVKGAYLAELVNDGLFAEHFGKDYNEPSWGDLANIDSLVSDEEMHEKWEGTEFTNDDFFCTAGVCAA